MSLLPTVFNGSLFDQVFSDPFFTGGNQASRSVLANASMTTDVKEKDGRYDVAIELPGFTKDDISVEVNDGYLTVTAAQKSSHDEKADDGKYLRRERYQGTRSRSFYVGKNLKSSDVSAKFADGVLHLGFAKESPEAERQLVEIEG